MNFWVLDEIRIAPLVTLISLDMSLSLTALCTANESGEETGSIGYTIPHREAGYRRDVGQSGTVRDSMISSPKCNHIGSYFGVLLSVYSILLRNVWKGQGAFML